MVVVATKEPGGVEGEGKEEDDKTCGPEVSKNEAKPHSAGCVSRLVV